MTAVIVDEPRAATMTALVRRNVSASVSELFTISARFESVILVLIALEDASDVRPLLNCETTLLNAVCRFALVRPPFICVALLTASVVNGLRFAIALLFGLG